MALKGAGTPQDLGESAVSPTAYEGVIKATGLSSVVRLGERKYTLCM
jgi:hypothetical protein